MPKKKKARKSKSAKSFPKVKPAGQKNSDAPQIVKRGLQHHQAGQMAQAEQLYKEAIALDPDNAEAYHLLGIMANQAGDITNAVKLIRKVLSIQPGFVTAHFNLGVALEKSNHQDEAVLSYEKAISLKPDYIEAHNNLGNIFMGKHQWNNAISCFKKVIALNPNIVEAHFRLGVALAAENQIDQAISSYQKALNLRPDLPEALNNLANLLNGKGDFNNAIPLYLKAVSIKDDYPNAYNNLGVALKETNQLDEALQCFEKAIQLKPDYAEAYNNMGNVFEKKGCSDDAISSYQKALAICPDDARASYNLGTEMEKVGRSEEAVGFLKKALALNPDNAEAHMHLANSIDHGAYDDGIMAMENLYRREGLAAEDKMHLGFGLGKAFSDLNEYEKSFQYLLEANTVKRRMFDYSISDDQALFRDLKEVFTQDFLAGYNGVGHDDGTPVFILGMPRSGTTLVEQILASHPQVYGAGELIDLSKVIQTLMPKGTSFNAISTYSAKDYEQAGQEYIRRVRTHSKAAVHITDKMPHNFLFIGFIHTILPKAKVIHCRRDPMDTCFSIFKNLFDKKSLHKYAYDLKELGQYYKLYLDMMAYWHRVLPGFMHEVTYETLICEPAAETGKLLEFCGIPWDERCLTFYKTPRKVLTLSSLQVRKPIYKDSVQLWKQYRRQLAPLEKEIFG